MLLLILHSFDQLIKEITKITFYQLRNIAKIRSFLSTADAEILIHASISSRLDYCNALFSSLLCESTKSLQMVQNAAATVLTRSRKFDHITPILASLHWLPVHIRSDYKVLLMTYKTVHSTAVVQTSDLITPYIPTSALRSQNSGFPGSRRGQLAAGFPSSGITSQLTSDNLALLTPLNLNSKLTSSI